MIPLLQTFADTVDIIEIVYGIEEKFGISIPFGAGDVLLAPKPGPAFQESMTKL